MNNNKFPLWPLGVLAIVTLVWLGINSDHSPFNPLVPTDGEPGEPNMIPVFATNPDRAEAKQHALAMATICESLAEVIEYDGTLESPRYTSGVQLEDLRTMTRKYRMRGWSFSLKYPGIIKTMEAFLNDKIGVNGGKLTPDRRKLWVEAYRQIGKSCRYAAR